MEDNIKPQLIYGKGIHETDKVTYLPQMRQKKKSELQDPLDGFSIFEAYDPNLSLKEQPFAWNCFPIKISRHFAAKRRFHFYTHTSGLLVGQDELYTNPRLEVLQAREYWDQCEKLHQSMAGVKAMDLLKEFLSEGERDELDKTGQFRHFVTFDWDIRDDNLIKHSTNSVLDPGPHYAPDNTLEASFQFQPHFSINVYQSWMPTVKMAGVCWHPEEPLPPGDIALVHLMEMEASPEHYLEMVNY